MAGPDRNPIDAALAGFLESPVMIIVGSCDDGLLPQIARAWTVKLPPAGDLPPWMAG